MNERSNINKFVIYLSAVSLYFVVQQRRTGCQLVSVWAVQVSGTVNRAINLLRLDLGVGVGHTAMVLHV